MLKLYKKPSLRSNCKDRHQRARGSPERSDECRVWTLCSLGSESRPPPHRSRSTRYLNVLATGLYELRNVNFWSRESDQLCQVQAELGSIVVLQTRTPKGPDDSALPSESYSTIIPGHHFRDGMRELNKSISSLRVYWTPGEYTILSPCSSSINELLDLMLCKR